MQLLGIDPQILLIMGESRDRHKIRTVLKYFRFRRRSICCYRPIFILEAIAMAKIRKFICLIKTCLLNTFSRRFT